MNLKVTSAEVNKNTDIVFSLYLPKKSTVYLIFRLRLKIKWKSLNKESLTSE